MKACGAHTSVIKAVGDFQLSALRRSIRSQALARAYSSRSSFNMSGLGVSRASTETLLGLCQVYVAAVRTRAWKLLTSTSKGPVVISISLSILAAAADRQS